MVQTKKQKVYAKTQIKTPVLKTTKKFAPCKKAQKRQSPIARFFGSLKANPVKLLVTLTTTISASLVAFSLIIGGVLESRQPTLAEQYPNAYEFVLKSDFGKPLTLPLNENPIAVVLEGFDVQARNQAAAAIEQLDQISEAIDYVILDRDDAHITQKITIDGGEFFDHSQTSALGVTYLRFNNHTGEIQYPINIEIDRACTFLQDSSGQGILDHVIKHEMLHTLGFADMYQDEYQDKTIMYYALSADRDVTSFTELDELNIQRLYDEQYIKVETPTHIAFYYLPSKESFALTDEIIR
ncbi:MAG: hypothetical protein E7378_04455 [Clostridiales bacterium]|nr:hypothetical protein [Clostridiales bacterium]